MKSEDYQDWDDLLAMLVVNDVVDSETLISVDRQDLMTIANDLSRLVYATERHFYEVEDRLVYEHRERFRQDLIHMNNIRIRLNSLLRDAR